MDDEAIFGPLNLKQFYCVAIAFGLIFIIYNFLSTNVSIPLIIIVIVLFIPIIYRNKSVDIDMEYIKRKRYSFKNKDEFNRWLERRIANTQFQISKRQVMGQVPDISLNKKMDLLETALKEIK